RCHVRQQTDTSCFGALDDSTRSHQIASNNWANEMGQPMRAKQQTKAGSREGETRSGRPEPDVCSEREIGTGTPCWSINDGNRYSRQLLKVFDQREGLVQCGSQFLRTSVDDSLHMQSRTKRSRS